MDYIKIQFHDFLPDFGFQGYDQYFHHNKVLHVLQL